MTFTHSLSLSLSACCSFFFLSLSLLYALSLSRACARYISLCMRQWVWVRCKWVRECACANVFSPLLYQCVCVCT